MIEESKKHVDKTIGKTVETAEKAAAHPHMQRLGRFGYFTKGVLYILVGGLAALVATGMGGELTDRRGALETIEAAPFGTFLLIAALIGSFGYGLWSILRGAADVDGKGSDAKGLATRFAYIGVGLSYFFFAWAIWRVINLARDAAGSSTERTLSESLLDKPFGVWLLLLIGLAIIGVGIYQIYKAFSRKFLERVDLSSLKESSRKYIILFGKLGFVARGVVFGIIGYFLALAAWTYNPKEAKGVDGALAAVASQSYGKILLLLVSVGLIFYGLFSIVESFYRRFGRVSSN